MRPDVVQRVAVLMHFDAAFAREVFGAAHHSALADDELALLQRVDPRAFRTDPERPVRLLAALLEEFPVSCAILGAPALGAFTSSSLFRNAILRGRLVADAFGDWLFARVGGPAQLELATALARRRRRRRAPPHGREAGVGALWARAPGVELAKVPAGTLAFFVDARARLGPRAHEAVAAGARAHAPPHAGLEELLVVDGADGPDIAPCASALFSLLSFARDGRTRAELVTEAARLGADDDAAGVVDDLVADALLAPV